MMTIPGPILISAGPTRKTKNPKKAIDNYLEASRRDPQFANAFLRAGILYARQQDRDLAIASFDRAETIFKAVGNFEGEAEVSFQRGAFFNKISNIPEARKHLGRALELAKTTNNDYQQVKTLQKLGDVEIDAGNFAEGRRLMLDAIDLARSKGIDNLIKRGLVDLGNTYLVQGNYPETEKYFTQSLDLSLQQKDPRNAARARLALASSAERQGNSTQVISLVEQALPFYQHGAYRKELIQALTLLARASVQQGNYTAAEQAFEQELKLSEQYIDLAQASLAHEDLGLLRLKQTRYPEAVNHLEKCYEFAKSLGTLRNIASCLVARSNAYWRLGRYDEARRSLSEASAFAELPEAPKTVATAYYLTQALIALSERHFPEAASQSEKALTFSGQLKRSTVIATCANSLAQAMTGSAAGRLKCQDAVDTARSIGDPLLLSDSLLMLAQAQLQKGDAEAASKSALEAQQLAARVGSRESEFNAWCLAARSRQVAKDSSAARTHATNAMKLLQGLEQTWGSAPYNSFLSRPDIQFSRTQLNEILAQKSQPQ